VICATMPLQSDATSFFNWLTFPLAFGKAILSLNMRHSHSHSPIMLCLPAPLCSACQRRSHSRSRCFP
jgi:hypothetical protein